ncbi:hypothetical protein BC835DRAFT_418739 [Cytidiella melzeri]|nr:hypothetical protein BC835DRAFT_418739 [Cytidiella melzeri]
MENSNSYYPARRSGDPTLTEWPRSNKAVNSSWGRSAPRAVADDEDLPSPLLEIDDDIAHALQCVWTASSSSSDSDPFASRSSVSSASVLDGIDIPEIPFISELPEEDEQELVTPFWLRRRPAVSTTSSQRQLAVLGQAAERHFVHARQRSGSISSTASRPTPAKSILSSSSSIKTRKGRSAPSVKFLDMPTIHFEDDDDEKPYVPTKEYGTGKTKVWGPSKGRKRNWNVLEWFVSSSKKRKTHAVASDRPLISSPLPLCEGRRPSVDDPTGGRYAHMDARSIRSVRSTSSMRSVRSCASRFQGYLTWLGGKDP